MRFHDLQRRLLAALKARLRNGELTERQLARLTGISQPHIHNVLKGARILSPKIADQILEALRMSLLDLPAEDELQASFDGRHQYHQVAVLDGWLGPGLPLPRMPSQVERYPFPRPYVTALEYPVVARLAPDRRMWPAIRENDLVLLDHAKQWRNHPEPGRLYVVSRRGEGVIRRVLAGKRNLFLITEDAVDQAGRWERVPLAGNHVLDIVQARVVWLGRDLRQGVSQTQKGI